MQNSLWGEIAASHQRKDLLYVNCPDALKLQKQTEIAACSPLASSKDLLSELASKKRSLIYQSAIALVEENLTYKDFTMPKPLGYYANFSPGDESALDELREMFGEYLEKLTTKEKFFLIAAIAAQQAHDLPGMISPAVHCASAGVICDKDKTDLTGLLAALIDYAKPVHHS